MVQVEHDNKWVDLLFCCLIEIISTQIVPLWYFRSANTQQTSLAHQKKLALICELSWSYFIFGALFTECARGGISLESPQAAV